MTNWIPHPTILSGEIVELIPLEKEHIQELEILAKDNRIWEFYSYSGADSAKLRNVLTEALDEREKGNQYPFVIFYKPSSKLIGSTRFMNVHSDHRKLEIGATWLHPDFWSTA